MFDRVNQLSPSVAFYGLVECVADKYNKNLVHQAVVYDFILRLRILILYSRVDKSIIHIYVQALMALPTKRVKMAYHFNIYDILSSCKWVTICGIQFTSMPYPAASKGCRTHQGIPDKFYLCLQLNFSGKEYRVCCTTIQICLLLNSSLPD